VLHEDSQRTFLSQKSLRIYLALATSCWHCSCFWAGNRHWCRCTLKLIYSIWPAFCLLWQPTFSLFIRTAETQLEQGLQLALFVLSFWMHNHWGEQNCFIMFPAQMLRFSTALEEEGEKAIKIIKHELWDNTFAFLALESSLNVISMRTTNLGRNKDN